MEKTQILIVEDNRIVAEDIKQTLEILGYEIVGIATSGKKAMEMVKHTRVDMALMDINLGKGVNGIKVAQHFKEKYQIPVVYLTAHADKKIIGLAKKTEPFGYLVKPFNKHELQSTLEVALYKYKSDLKVKKSEQKYRTFVENFQGIAFRGFEDFSIDFITGNVKQITGYSQTDFISGKVMYKDLIHPDDIGRIKREVKAFMASDQVFAHREYKIIDKLENVHWVSENISKVYGQKGQVCVDGTIQDITTRKQAESRIGVLKIAVDNSAESICITDANGIIEYVNDAFEKLSGYSRKELIGSNPNVLQSGQHSTEFYKDMWQTLTDKKTWYGTFINRKKDTGIYHEKATISPVLDDDQNITHYIAVKRDITEDLAKEKMFQQSQKMEAIGTLAGGIAHDFNNILSPILGFSQLSLSSVEKGSVIEDNLEEINKAAIRAKDLVKQILTFARRSDEGISPIKIYPIVKETLKFIRSSIPVNIKIKSDIENTDHVMADPTRIHQILMNLFTNAYQAMEEESGTLEVTLKNIDKDEVSLIHIHDLIVQNYVKLTVSDTGCGIAPDKINAIFEPYFTTKKTGEGTGLGLAVCQGAVKSMKGEIFVESTLGQGTVFSVYLPVSQDLVHSSIPVMDNEELPQG